jgi:hypothetical protein
MLPVIPEVRPPAPLAKTGGCTNWSTDNRTCLQYRFTAAQLGVTVINEHGIGLRAYCRNMPGNVPVDIQIEGIVSCSFTNNYGNHCGDS